MFMLVVSMTYYICLQSVIACKKMLAVIKLGLLCCLDYSKDQLFFNFFLFYWLSTQPFATYNIEMPHKISQQKIKLESKTSRNIFLSLDKFHTMFVKMQEDKISTDRHCMSIRLQSLYISITTNYIIDHASSVASHHVLVDLVCN
jgi:hypothetical protein